MKCLSLVTLLVAGTIVPLASAQEEAWQQAKQNARANKAEVNAARRSQAVAPQAVNRRPNLTRRNFNPAGARAGSGASYNPDVRVQARGGRPIITRRTNMQPTVANQTADISPAIAPNTRRVQRGNRGGRNLNAIEGDRGRRNRGSRTPTEGDPGSFGNNDNNDGGNRDLQNGERRGRGGRHQAFHNRHEGDPNFAQTHQRWHRQHQNRSWWRNHYSRFALFGGGYYYWNAGYWYPAYGYDSNFSTYTYDAPLYGYNDLEPGEVIAQVQAELQRQGYDPGLIDGDFGPATRAALLAYQQDNGLPVTGEIDEDTLGALGLE